MTDTMTFDELMEYVVRGFEATGVIVLALGSLAAALTRGTNRTSSGSRQRGAARSRGQHLGFEKIR